MQGSIHAESVVDEGSTFFFDIVLEHGTVKNTANDNNAIPACDVSKIRALIIDNYPRNIEILNNYLANMQIENKHCSSAEQGLRLMKEYQGKGQAFDIVFIDWHLDGMNGDQFARKIRAAEDGLQDTLLVLMSSTLKGSCDDVKKIGFSGYLTKPFYPKQLDAMMKLLWHATINKQPIGFLSYHDINAMLHSSLENEKKREQNKFQNVRVLVVEDMPVNRMLMKKTLEKYGCNIDFAEDGQIAVDKMQNESFDIVFMDCQMPNMDGFEATAHIRINEAKSGIKTPIVALTADAMQGDREKCLNAGMDDYMNKPIKPSRISEILNKWIKRADAA